MRVAIDVRTVTPVRSGVGNYVLHLLRGLKRVAPDQDFMLVGQPGNLELLAEAMPHTLAHRTMVSHESHPMGDLWEHLWLPGILRRHGVRVMHGPATLIPLARAGFSTVVTIHDLVAFLFPDTIPRKYALYMRWLISQVVKRADRIISVSHNTKEDLMNVLGVRPDKISVVHEAAQPNFQPVGDRSILDDVCRRYGVDGPFLYHVGNIEPRKNLVRLIKAFMILRREWKEPVRLVITGQKGWLTGKLFRALDGVELSPDVIFTGYVPHEDLPLLMNAAQAFIFPSLYEGFGLPVLEAMSCGTPVLTSNISSLPEIVGDAAVLVDPYNEQDIAEGMHRVLFDSELRVRLAREGIKQAARFSWDKAARGTLAVYHEVSAKGAGK